MPFPVTPRYFLRFRNSDTGLTPSFVYFQRADTFANITPPTIYEKGNGTYYFDWPFTTKSDPDLVFQVDGGASIPTEEVRYISGSLSPRDRFLDEPISQVVTDVWSDNVSYSAGQKGLRVDQIGDPGNTSSSSTLFGKTLLYKESIRGDSAGLSDGDDIKQVYTRIGLPVTADISHDIAAVQTTTTAIQTVEGIYSDASGAHTLFGEMYASRDNIKGSGNKDLTQVDTDVNALSTPINDVNNNVTAVKAETDKIGDISDPSSASTLFGVGAAITGYVENLTPPDNTSIAAIKLETDKIGDYTNLATAHTLFGCGLAIKLQTDLLPGDPASQATTNTSISNAVTNIKGSGNMDLTQVDTDVEGVNTTVGNVNTNVNSVKTETDKIGDYTDAPSAQTVFGRIYASQNSIMGPDSRNLTGLAGAGFDTSLHSLTVMAGGLILRALGMLHENSVLDVPPGGFNSDNNLVQARVRLYDGKTNTDAARALSLVNPGTSVYDTGKIAEYSIICSYTGTNMSVYEVSRVA